MKNEKLSMVIEAKIIGEAGDQKAKLSLEYNNLDYKNVVEIETELTALITRLNEIGKSKVPQAK